MKSGSFLKNSIHVIERKGTCLVANNYNTHPSTKKRLRRMFHKDYGDLPVVATMPKDSFFDPVVFLEVVNHRGQAYGLRNAKRYQKARLLKLKYKGKIDCV
jgi:hypothetical protein